MAAFVSGSFSLTSTATKIVESSEFDRSVVLSTASGAVEIGYSNSTMAPLFLGSGFNKTVALPAGQELWALASSGTQTLGILVTVR